MKSKNYKKCSSIMGVSQVSKIPAFCAPDYPVMVFCTCMSILPFRTSWNVEQKIEEIKFVYVGSVYTFSSIYQLIDVTPCFEFYPFFFPTDLCLAISLTLPVILLYFILLTRRAILREA